MWCGLYVQSLNIRYVWYTFLQSREFCFKHIKETYNNEAPLLCVCLCVCVLELFLLVLSLLVFVFSRSPFPFCPSFALSLSLAFLSHSGLRSLMQKHKTTSRNGNIFVDSKCVSDYWYGRDPQYCGECDREYWYHHYVFDPRIFHSSLLYDSNIVLLLLIIVFVFRSTM